MAWQGLFSECGIGQGLEALARTRTPRTRHWSARRPKASSPGACEHMLGQFSSSMSSVWQVPARWRSSKAFSGKIEEWLVCLACVRCKYVGKQKLHVKRLLCSFFSNVKLCKTVEIACKSHEMIKNCVFLQKFYIPIHVKREKNTWTVSEVYRLRGCNPST